MVVMTAQLCDYSTKTIESYALKEWILWYVNYVPIKAICNQDFEANEFEAQIQYKYARNYFPCKDLDL